MMTGKRERSEVLYQVVKFPIYPTQSELAVLQKVSDNLWQVRNEAISERFENFETHHAPLYAALKALKEGVSGWDNFITQTESMLREARWSHKQEDVQRLRRILASAKVHQGKVSFTEKGLKTALKESFINHNITHFDQCKALTPRRKTSPTFAAVPCAWQQETLKTLDGGFKSWLVLRKKGDVKARPPRPQQPNDFTEIEGLLSFQVEVESDKVVAQKPISETTLGFLKKGARARIILSPGKDLFGSNAPLAFPLPEYSSKTLSKALRVKKFTLYRTPADIRKKGRFWLSLAFEIKKPETTTFIPEEAVYIALGASAIGIVSPRGEEEIRLERADKHFLPKIRAIEKSLGFVGSGTNLHPIKEGSKKWRKLQTKKSRMRQLTRDHGKHNRRTIVRRKLVDDIEQDLLRHGTHFVVTEMVIRGKKGALADGSRPERGGDLGLNWSAQNSGAIASLVVQLEQKAKEVGGSVRKFRSTSPPQSDCEKKISMARRLRDDFLTAYDSGLVK